MQCSKNQTTNICSNVIVITENVEIYNIINIHSVTHDLCANHTDQLKCNRRAQHHMNLVRVNILVLNRVSDHFHGNNQQTNMVILLSSTKLWLYLQLNYQMFLLCIISSQERNFLKAPVAIFLLKHRNFKEYKLHVVTIKCACSMRCYYCEFTSNIHTRNEEECIT
jgi:hypothetical protein